MITLFPPMKPPEADHGLRLCEQLANAGLEMHVISQQGSVVPSNPRITVYPIMQKWSWLELPRLVRTAKRCAPDAILLVYLGWIYEYHPMLTFTPTILRRFIGKVPFVTLIHDDMGSCAAVTSFPSRVIRKTLALWLGPKDLDYGFGTLLRDSDRLIVVSENVQTALAKRCSRVNGKSVVIPCPPIMQMVPEDDGTARRLKRAALELKEDEFLIAYFGYIYEGKGVETLFKAFQIVKGQRRPVRLIMIGGYLGNPSYFEKIQAMSKGLGIEDKVIWTGQYAWNSDEGSRCLRAADICVLPHDKGISIHNSSLAGACAHGLPVITTRDSITESLFIHKANVFLCPPKNPDTLAQAMETVMAQPELRQQLSIGASDLATRWYSWDNAVKGTVAALRAQPV